MRSLSKFRAKSQFRAIRKFTNREKPQQTYLRAFSHFCDNTNPMQVIMYYGIGGIGKTSLLNHLKQETEALIENDNLKDKIKTIFISLDSYQFSSPIEILLSIRNHLGIATHLFDYALLKYWSAVGNTVLDLKKKGIHGESIVWDILEFVSSATTGLAPFSLLKKGFENIKMKYHLSKADGEEVQHIDILTEGEIVSRLPYYLGLAIEKAATREDYKFVFFIDAHEVLKCKLENVVTCDEPDEWLRELIGASEHGLFVIGGREYLKWADTNPVWGDFLDQHILGHLTDQDADYFLSSVPISDDSIRQSIVKVSKGLPLYLDLCVTIYLRLRAEGHIVKTEDFQIAENEIIFHFINHLPRDEREAIKVTSLLNFFDKELFIFLMKELNISLSYIRFYDFVDSCSIKPIDEKRFKIHDIIRVYIINNTPTSLKHTVLKATICYVLNYIESDEYENLSIDFSQLIELTVKYGGENTKDIECLLDIGFRLINNGYWVEVANILNHYNFEQLQERIVLSTAFCLLQGVSLRRLGKLKEANRMFSQIENSLKLLGKYHNFARFRRANVIRLLGNYNQAEALYSQLVTEIHQPTKSDYNYRVLRQWSDLLFLKGRFCDATQQLNALLSGTNGQISLEIAETIRIVGHIHRFNLDFDSALNAYNQSLSMARQLKAIGLIGKLYTNITETLCWSDPSAMLSIGKESLELNEDLKAPIEIGKTLTALAIGHTLGDKNLSKAQMLVTKSLQLQQEAGYRSGELFVHIAESFIRMVKGNRTGVIEKLCQTNTLVTELDVYHFLQLPLVIYLSNEAAISTLKNKTQWMNFPKTCSEYEQILRRL
jgi:tetratricopeptide (TPR) repeat protein